MFAEFKHLSQSSKMSNQAEIDYDKKFQEELAIATELSLETQVLDDYKRAKKYGYAYSRYTPAQTYGAASNRPSSSNISSIATGSSFTSAVPQLSAPPAQANRRHSEASNNNNISSTSQRSKTPPATLSADKNTPENDLISFASPTTKNNEHVSSFEQLIQNLQNMPTTHTQQALVPVGAMAAAQPARPVYAATAAAAYAGYPRYAAASPATMQMVPYTAPAAQQKVPLTNEELKKLYNMSPANNAVASYAPAYAGTSYYAGNSMPAAAAAAPALYPQITPSLGFIPPQYPAYSVGYGMPYGFVNNSAAYAAQRPNNLPVNSNNLGQSALNMSQQQQQPQQPFALPKTQSSSTVDSAAAVSKTTMSATGAVRRSSLMSKQRTASASATGNDLIDLNQEDDSRVSVLEAFDPLLNEDDVRKLQK